MTARNKINLLLIVVFLCTAVNYIVKFNDGTAFNTIVFAVITVVLLLIFKSLNTLFSSITKLSKAVSEAFIQSNQTPDGSFHTLNKGFTAYSRIISDSSRFIHDLKSGNLNSSIEEDENMKLKSTLIQDLLDLRNQMSSINEEEEQRKWKADGMALFTEILRKNHSKREDYYQDIISNLVKYFNANQGGLFLVNMNEEETSIDLAACYAYERRKYLTKELKVGEGLVGQAYLEQSHVYIKNIPEEYTNIVSSLGSAKPRTLLVIPFKSDENVECIVEMASFNEILPYQIDFLEKLGENIASAVSSFRKNDRTRLLLEASQQQTEELKSQEEEMKQNMEELEATQEEMRRKEAEMVKLVDKLSTRELELKEKLEEIETMKLRDEEKSKEILKTLEEHEKTLIEVINKLPQKIFLKDKDGKFLLANNAVAEAHKLSVDELLGKSDFDFFDLESATDYRNKELEIIKSGKPVYFPEEIFKDKNGTEKILQTTKMPFYIGYLNQMGLLGIQTDITEVKKLEEEVKKKNK
ncbi:MAG TPA: PAS domain S-box protein [Cytophagales bacterium]|nr:PAS domain S-box protein [Cytophagales bacterium]